MASDSLPAAESQIMATLANTLGITFDQLSTPVLQARSALLDSAVAAKVGAVFQTLTMENLIASLKVVGGIVAIAEGVSILANAGTLGMAAVSLVGATGVMASATVIVVGMGVAMLGTYLLFQGLDVLKPIVTARLRSEFGSAWDMFWSDGGSTGAGPTFD